MKDFAEQRFKPWMIYAMALAGISINVTYFGIRFSGQGQSLFSFIPFGHAGHIAAFFLFGVFPLLAVAANRLVRGHPRNGLTRSLERELDRLTREVAELKHFCEKILSGINDLVFVIGSDGRLQYASDESDGVLGYEPEELLGRQLIDLLAPGSVAPAVESFEKIMRGMEVEPYELRIKDGRDSARLRCLQITTTGYLDNGRVVAQVCLAREITERLSLEERVSARNRELAALYQLAATAGQTLDLDEVLENALDQVLPLLAADRAWIHLYDSSADQLTFKLWKQAGGESEVVKEVRRLKPGSGFSGMVVKRGSSIVINVDDLEEASAGMFKRCGDGSLAAMPMLFRGRLVGVLGVAGSQPDHFGQAEIEVLEVASIQIAMFIGNSRLYQDLKKRTAELERRNEELAGGVRIKGIQQIA
ncbi:MAG: GAF domain-containing protein [Thermoleophilia bacterium]|nr:GAF domain-containing protein [Thermoleophilia bacterium]